MDANQGNETAPKPPETPQVLSDAALDASARGAELTDADRAVLEYPDLTLSNGTELLTWWKDRDRTGDFAERCDVVREFAAGDGNFGFFDVARVNGADLPVMGIEQEMFYDRQKVATGQAIRDQFKEFVLRYFMRVSHLREPEAMGEDGVPAGSRMQRALSWRMEDSARRVGFGYQQLYYKRHGSGVVGKFRDEERSAIVDLREIGSVYDWILLKVDIFDFNLQFSPLGSDVFRFQLPLKESTYLVLGPAFVTNEDKPEPGVLGRYGFGYAFLPYAPEPGMIAYGPGHFAAAIQTVNFTLMENGEIRVRAVFVVNRPDKIARVDIAPIDWGFKIADAMTFNMASRMMSPVKSVADRLPVKVSGLDPISSFIWLANTMTGGRAERQLGISKATLERRMLVQHYMQHYEMLMSSLRVWRTVTDWTDHDNLPDYCRFGSAC
jgi:hypothetical protein